MSPLRKRFILRHLNSSLCAAAILRILSICNSSGVVLSVFDYRAAAINPISDLASALMTSGQKALTASVSLLEDVSVVVQWVNLSTTGPRSDLTSMLMKF